MTRALPRAAALLIGCLLAWPANVHAQTFTVAKNDIGGTGAFDYITAEPGTGRVFISRSNHLMVVDGPTGKVLGDIPNTPGTHGAVLVPKHNRGFTTNGGDSTVTMFDLKTLAVIKKIETHTGGLDGFFYDDFTDRVFTGNHSRPAGTATAIDPVEGTVIGAIALDGTPEAGVTDGKGRAYINIEDKSEIQVFDPKTLKSIAIWSLAPCDGPSGLAIDRQTMRLFAACSNGMTAVMDATSGKVVAQIPIGPGPDAIGFDPSQKLIYTPGGGGRGAGAGGTVTIAHEDSPDTYTVVATVTTMNGARTLALDTEKHLAYVFTPEYGPAPATPAGSTPPAGGTPPGRGGGRGARGPVIASWLFVISH